MTMSPTLSDPTASATTTDSHAPVPAPRRAPWNEAERLAALHRYEILDTPREPEFDDVARLAADIFEAPIGVVNLIAEGRQWFKAEVGIGTDELPLDVSICAHAILQQGIFVVPDTTKDERFRCNRLVAGDPGLRFYAGALLQTPEGLPLGTVCVLDTEPRPEGITERQRLTLEVLARQVMSQLELRRALAQRDVEVARARRSEERLSLVLDSARDYVILTTDPERRITSFSAGAEATFGLSEKEAVGRLSDELFTPEDRAAGRPEDELAEARKEGRAADIRWHQRADGSRVFLNGSVHPLPLDEQGRERGFIKIARDETERQASEAALAASEAYLRIILDNAVDGLYGIDADGITTFCNKAFLRMLGFTREEDAVGRKLHDIIHHSHPDGSPYDRRDCPIYTAGQSGAEVHVEDELFFRLDGTSFPVEYWVRPIEGGGEIQGSVCTFVDITERKAAEEALRASEARLRELNQTLERRVEQAIADRDRTWNNARDLLLVVGSDGTFRAVNPAWQAVLGWQADELVGHSYLEFIHPDDHPSSEEALVVASADNLPVYENRYRHKDGSYRVISWVAAAEGDMIYASGRDVTHEKERAAALRLFENIVQSDNSPVCAFDQDYRLTAFNQAHSDEFFRIFGHRVRRGEVFPDLFPPDQAPTMRAFMARALAGETYTIVEEFGDPDLAKPYWEVSYSPLRDEAGRIIGAFHHARDISARLRAEAELHSAQEALRQSQKMEAVGQLTGGIAHDFNNLLTGVIGSLDMMQRRMAQGQTDRIEHYTNTALAAANRAAALTHRLLAFSRRQPLDPQPVNANRLVAGTEELLRRTIGESIRLEFVTAGGLWQTLCDPHQLENAILNLAINARDAMPEGGRLTIETCNAHLDDAYAGRQREIKPGQYVCIAVSDTGIGMKREIVEKAFDPFFTTKPIGQGTGLGLSMIYGFARQSEGYAKIYSEEGRGTTVKLYLPRYHGDVEEAEEEGEELSDAQRAEAGEVVLVVEDESAVRELVVDVLQELGYRAVEASDGGAGLKLLESEMRVDLLVTDIGLPGLNGRELADAARKHRPDLKVLFMTGYAENATVANGFLDPGMQMMTKPFAIDALATRIRDMIEGG